MQTSTRARLRPLKDADLRTRDPAEDIRGRKVVDASGEELGKIDDLLIDDEENKVRLLRLKSGGFLGLGASKVLIPVEAISEIGQDVVHIDQTRNRVAAAPPYDPELVDDSYFNSLYGYYGYSPFWAPGYMYPSYPYYPNVPNEKTSRRF